MSPAGGGTTVQICDLATVVGVESECSIYLLRLRECLLDVTLTPRSLRTLGSGGYRTCLLLGIGKKTAQHLFAADSKRCTLSIDLVLIRNAETLAICGCGFKMHHPQINLALF